MNLLRRRCTGAKQMVSLKVNLGFVDHSNELQVKVHFLFLASNSKK
jgi:hypothetical protein